MSLPVGEPLADDALNGPRSALNVIYAKPDAIGIAEIELGSIAVQMFFAAMLVHALHAALEHRIVILDGVGVRVTARPFFGVVIHGLMFSDVELAASKVGRAVGHEPRFARHVLADDPLRSLFASVFDLERTGFTVALHQGHDDHLVTVAGLGFASAFLSADEGFVGLDDPTSAAHRLNADNAHGFADSVSHEPSGFESDAQGPVKLVAGDTLLAGAKKVHRLQPNIHRDVAILEYGPDLHSELLAALVALVEANAGRFTGHLADALETPAMRANGAFRPHPLFNPSDCGCFVFHNIGGQDRIGHDTCFPYMNQGYQGQMGLSSTISPF